MRTEEEKLKRKERESAITILPQTKIRFKVWCDRRNLRMKFELTKAIMEYMINHSKNE